MNKILVLLLSISMLLILFSGCGNFKENSTTNESTSSTTDEQNQPIEPNPPSDFEYATNSDGSITIVQYIGSNEMVVIPDFIQDLPVTKIKDNAFRLNHATSVTMPNTIVEIGISCFAQCDKLKSIVLSNDLLKIGKSAFQECTQLKHITIPAKVTYIGDQAFEGAGLESIVFEEGIETIGGYGSFSSTKIKKLVLPSTVKEIGHSTFAANPNLETLILNEGLVVIGHKAFVNNPKLKEVIIPHTVEIITEMDFNMCSGLKKIMFDGDAPTTFEYSDEISGVWKPYNVHFTVYYHEGAKGFDSPEWYGYPTEIW